MAYDNTLYIMGNLGQDPEGGYFADGTAHAKLSIAISKKRRNKDGNYDEHTEWFAVLLRGNVAEFASKYLKKGNCVAVWGSIWSRSYTDKQGNARTVYEVHGDKVQFISAKPSQHIETDNTDTNSLM